LAEVASTLTAAGDHERAIALLDQAIDIARSIADPERQGLALARLAPMLAAAGEHDWAIAVAHSINDSYQNSYKQSQSLAGPAAGADTPAWLATAPEAEGITGRFFVRRKQVTTAPHTTDIARCDRLWDETARLAGLTTALSA
jgi:hypothetical protein